MPDNKQISTYIQHLRVWPKADVLDVLRMLEIKGKSRVREDKYSFVTRYPDGSRKDIQFRYAIVAKSGGYVDLIDVMMQCDEDMNPSKGWDSPDHKHYAWLRFTREFVEKEVFA